ncbi:MAG: hypothetical protein K0R39_4471 [Symbiobacteriaceae bacterium]|jgi:hypothetical protein|nr:hypothetical protein [Symbiobacteriaceae bacterium]
MKAVVIILCIALFVVAVGYWGLHVAPRPFAAYPGATPEMESIPLPAGLPAPVERFYRTVLGDRVPVVETAVITAHGHMRMFGLWLPHRMRVIHQAGQDYYTIIQPTFFGYPVVTLKDTYLKGVAHVDQPGFPDNHPKMNSASNLALWAESVDLPSIYLTDTRVRWEPIDETHARLVVPSPEGSDAFTVTFDEKTGRVAAMEALRWRNPGDTEKSRWRTDARDGKGQVTWNDEAPWFDMQVDQVLYNVDVSQYIEGR